MIYPEEMNAAVELYGKITLKSQRLFGDGRREGEELAERCRRLIGQFNEAIAVEPISEPEKMKILFEKNAVQREALKFFERHFHYQK